MANLGGRVRHLTWKPPNRVPRNTLPDACVEQVNFRSNYKVFLIFQQGIRINPWGIQEQSRHTDDPFAGPWNHWPVSHIPSDGRFAVANDRLTHAAVAASNAAQKGNMAIYGFSDKDVSALVPLARFWNNPPKLTDINGCISEGYDKTQRAYVLKAENMKLSFKIDCNKMSPVVNPAFVIKNWQANSKAEVKINGRKNLPRKKCRQGIVRDTDGQPTFILWLERLSDVPLNIKVSAQSN